VGTKCLVGDYDSTGEVRMWRALNMGLGSLDLVP
jgi:hypothetical protein